MESECGFKIQSVAMSRSESKAMVGQKRGIVEVEEMTAISYRRVKMRDLESSPHSETRGRWGSDAAFPVVHSAPCALDLNTNVGSVSNTVDDGPQECNDDFSKSRGFKLDLNAENISSSINHDPSNPYKTYEHSKSTDNSECGSSVGPLEGKDPMGVWNKMKQNGYLSTSHGAAAIAMPKPRVRNSKNDMMKKKIELAKKEQVDRFAKFAAPSGLLNGLNPGIINHVRNSKQVHSIIEALVRSERSENRHSGSKQDNLTKCSMKEFTDKEDLEKTNCLEVNSEDILSRSRHPSLRKPTSLNSELTGGNNYSCKRETKIFESKPSYSHIENEDDGLTLKLSSCVTIASENISSLSNQESTNLSSTVTSLSVKAANVASQWLELLKQDIKGRLEALRRSKKRVQAVINTELPCLMSREFSSNQENDLYTIGSNFPRPDKATANAHFVRWRTMFQHMDKALSEEESQLESWLNQVKEMQLWSEPTLSKHSGGHCLHQTSPNNCRFREANDSERDLAVQAAAASIVSFLELYRKLSQVNHNSQPNAFNSYQMPALPSPVPLANSNSRDAQIPVNQPKAEACDMESNKCHIAGYKITAVFLLFRIVLLLTFCCLLMNFPPNVEGISSILLTGNSVTHLGAGGSQGFYATYFTSIHGTYLLFVTGLIIAGIWTCCKFGKRGRHHDGVLYQELKMGSLYSNSSLRVGKAEHWDRTWVND